MAASASGIRPSGPVTSMRNGNVSSGWWSSASHPAPSASRRWRSDWRIPSAVVCVRSGGRTRARTSCASSRSPSGVSCTDGNTASMSSPSLSLEVTAGDSAESMMPGTLIAWRSSASASTHRCSAALRCPIAWASSTCSPSTRPWASRWAPRATSSAASVVSRSPSLTSIDATISANSRPMASSSVARRVACGVALEVYFIAAQRCLPLVDDGSLQERGLLRPVLYRPHDNPHRRRQRGRSKLLSRAMSIPPCRARPDPGGDRSSTRCVVRLRRHWRARGPPGADRPCAPSHDYWQRRRLRRRVRHAGLRHYSRRRRTDSRSPTACAT